MIFFTINHAEMENSDQIYVSKFYLDPERTGYMTEEDLIAEKKKLEKMVTMINNALALRESAPKNEILQIVAKKVENIEGLKKNWKSLLNLRRLFSWMRLRLSNSSLQQ